MVDQKEPEKMADNEQKGTFYNHLSQDKSTRFGNWRVKNSSKQIFEFAQMQQGCSVPEIDPGQGVSADICLGNGVEYLAIEPNAKMDDALEKRRVNVLRSIVPPIPETGRSFEKCLFSVRSTTNQIQN